MFATAIPAWLLALDGKKPYVEVLDGERLPNVSPKWHHGVFAVRIAVQMEPWAAARGGATAVEVRFYFHHPDGRWSSLLPDLAYVSAARIPRNASDDEQRPRTAPDIAVEVLSPGDRPGRTQKKVDTYLAFGSALVVVLDVLKRRAALHRTDGTVTVQDARGSFALAPFDDLVLDWDAIYRGIDLNR